MIFLFKDFQLPAVRFSASYKMSIYPLLQGLGKPQTINKYYYHLNWQPKQEIKTSLKPDEVEVDVAVKKILFERNGFAQDSEKGNNVFKC